MATETPLWQKVYLGRLGRVYRDTAKIIGYLGCRGTEFFDKAKLLPDYEKFRFENAVRDLTVYMKPREGRVRADCPGQEDPQGHSRPVARRH